MPTAASAWQQQPAAASAPAPAPSPSPADGSVSSVCHRRVLAAHFRRGCQIAATFSCFNEFPKQKRRQRASEREREHSSALRRQTMQMSIAAAAATTAEQSPHSAQCNVTSLACVVFFFLWGEFISLA